MANRYHILTSCLGQNFQTVVFLLLEISEKLFSSSGPDSAILPNDNYLASEGIRFHSAPLPPLISGQKQTKKASMIQLQDKTGHFIYVEVLGLSPDITLVDSQ